MFYLSDENHTLDGILYGITDTNDNVTEYYSKDEIKKFLSILGHTSIRGVVYTGSNIVCRRTTPAIEKIKDLESGSPFTLRYSNVDYNLIKVGESADCRFVIVLNDKKEKQKFAYKILLRDKDVVEVI